MRTVGSIIGLAILRIVPCCAATPAAADAMPPGEIMRLKGHTDAVFAVAISPDGKRIVSGSNDGAAIVWDVASGKALARLEGHSAGVTGVGFSADAGRVVTGSLDHTARVWDARTGALLADLKGRHGTHVHAVAISPDGARVLTASCDCSAVLWDVATERPLKTYQHAGEAFNVAFAPDGKTFASGCHASGAGNGVREKNLRLYDAQTLAPIDDFDVENVAQLAYVDGGKRVVAIDDHTLWSLDVATRKLQTLRRLPAAAHGAMGASPDGKQFLVNGYFQTVLLDMDHPRPMIEYRVFREEVRALAIAPGGEWGVLAGGGRNIPWGQSSEQYEPARDADLHLFTFVDYPNPNRYTPDDPRKADDLVALTASAAGATAAGVYLDGAIVCWDPQSGRERARITWERAPAQIAMSPEGSLAAVLGNDGRLAVYEPDGKLVASTHVATDDGLFALAPAPDRRSVFAGGLRRGGNAEEKLRKPPPPPIETHVHQYDMATGKDLRPFRGPPGAIRALALSPDGRTLVGLCDDQFGGELAALAWDTQTANVAWTWRPKRGAATAPAMGSPKLPLGPLAIDPAGRAAAWACQNTTVLVDLATGKVAAEMTGKNPIRAIAFDPDGKRLWTAASYDVRSWDRERGVQISSIRCPTHAEHAAFRFAHDKHMLIETRGRELIEHELD